MSDATPITMDIQRILSILPHRYPFLLVDRVLECVPGSHIKAYKNVTINEPFFPTCRTSSSSSPAWTASNSVARWCPVTAWNCTATISA